MQSSFNKAGVKEDVDISVDLGGLKLKNPVVVASGTFGYGLEYEDFLDISAIGAVIVKGTTLEPRSGNPSPRIAETPAGMLNAIGLENPGVDVFLKEYLPRLRDKGVTVIVNIAGNTVEEYARMAAKIEGNEGVAAIELNISCPNVKKGGLQFGTHPDTVKEVVEAVKKETSLPVLPKLSPNVTDVVEIAKAAQAGGADALSMINTLLGMAIDIKKKKPVLANIFGGLSGPAIKPVALRMIYQVYKEVDLPILGGGGIMSSEDAVEFILAGASAVSIGTGNFVNPRLALEVVEGIRNYLQEENIRSVRELTGMAVIK
ncbi:dihydroorotate oxidase B, catalytic subunit [Thermosyntropha lipolytica DSM 11003]|uniref:Dihydroorotate dehydrogenase n=1 Tax=Thermosyntropha lipolytica DSM 11003 TaxID=1123382 RepID=A0A1M5PXD3_9FIRM|nr:dihydroorotate dehydrogenase [Thermosyntropha lipolytica]SHH06464.1 dihydroorotate oxidase B, catalytic subunit [Thermosyntropha lipolytica DSM 11003]